MAGQLRRVPWWVWGLGVGLVIVGGVVAYKERGLRNDNPLNLRSFEPLGWTHWLGAVGVDSAFHLIFSTPVYGIRAGFENLEIYNENHGITDLQGIFERWAPRGDKIGNVTANPDEYTVRVTRETGISAHQPLNFSDPNTMIPIVKAMVTVENGFNPYPDSLFAEAWRLHEVA